MPITPARRALLIASAAALLAGRAGRALATTADAAPLRLGTATAGGGFAQYGEMLERVLNASAGRVLLQSVRTRGTEENLVLLQRGELDAALIQGTAASELLRQGSASGLRVLYAMYPSAGMLAVPAASKAQRLEDLKGQRVVFGVRSSGLVTLARQVYDGIGLDIERDFDAVFVAQAAQAAPLVRDGDAVALWGGGEGWPAFVQMTQLPGGARFLGPTAAQSERIRTRYPLLREMAVPAGAYDGIGQPLPTVGSVNLIIARPGLDDSRAIAFVRAMHAAAAALAAALPQAGFSTLANTRAKIGRAHV